jgi:hypothetical protein
MGQAWWHTSVLPATWEAEICRITIQGQDRQKTDETPISTNKLGMMIHAVIPATQEIYRRITIPRSARAKTLSENQLKQKTKNKQKNNWVYDSSGRMPA